MGGMNAETILRSQGLKVNYGKSDGNDFYRQISFELYHTDKHPNRARTEICNFEKSVPYVDYFRLFIAKSDDGKAPTIETFYNDVKRHMQRNMAPSLREIRATAEKLRKEIYVFSRMDDSDEWKWFLFSPIRILPSEVNVQTDCLAFLRYETKGKIEFATVEENYLGRHNLRSTITEIMSMANKSTRRRNSTGSDIPDVISDDGLQHLYYCHKNHFCNWFTAGKSEILYQENELDFSENDTENWSTAKNSNFLKCVSKELYGSEKHYEFLSSICNRHSGISDKGVFQTILDVFEKTDKEDQKLLIESPDNVDMNSVSDKLISEVASVFNITICVTNSISKPTWEIYVPANEMWSFDSSILLLTAGGKYFRLRRRGEQFFLCDDVELLRPKEVDTQNNNVKSAIDIQIHGEASSNRRHSITSSDYRHDGLFNQVAEDFPVSVCLAENRKVKEYQPFSEFSQVMKRKDMNGRCIDHVTLDSQSFYRCISKEVFGSENFHSYLRNKVSTAMEECLPVTQPEESGKSSTKYSFLFGYHNRGFLPLTTEDQQTPDIVSSKEATDDEIMVASYLFKTPIYVLCCYSDGSSQWIEYNHIGIQPDVENYYRGRCRLDDKARGHYITLLRSSCGHYNRIVPRTKVCNCLMKPVDTNVQQQDDSLLKMNKNVSESDMARLTRYVERHVSTLQIATNDWDTAYNLLSEKCHQELEELSNKTKKLNVSNIISTSSGFVGTSSLARCFSGIFGLGIDDKAWSQLKHYEQEFRKHSEEYSRRVANSHQALTELNHEIKKLFANRTDSENTSHLYTVVVPAAMKTTMSVQLPPLVLMESPHTHPGIATTLPRATA